MAIGLMAVLLYELARAYYRPHIYANAINDFHIADTIGNTLGTVATAFAFASLLGRGYSQGLFVLRAAIMGVVAYELCHPLLGKQIDGWDVLATVLAGALCEIIYRALHRRFQRTAQRPAVER